MHEILIQKLKNYDVAWTFWLLKNLYIMCYLKNVQDDRHLHNDHQF